MIETLIARWDFAVGPLWNGYVVMIHATVYALGIVALVPLLRRYSCAAEAGGWTLATTGMLVVSALCWLPGAGWSSLLPRTMAEPLMWIGSTGVSAANGAVSPSLYAIAALYVAWIVGAGALLTRLAAAYGYLHWVTRRATRLDDRVWRTRLACAANAVGADLAVDVRMTPAVRVPLTWGILHPVVLLPAGSTHWTEEELDLALRHELAHIRRHDSLLQMAGELTRAWYWFHPGVWWLASRQRDAREHAVDARVIASGVRPSRYAAFLVAMHDRCGASHPFAAASPALTSGGLARRVNAALASGARRALPWPARVAGLVACVCWLLSVGFLRIAPQRSVSRSNLGAVEWSRRAYAVQLLSRTRSAPVRAEIERLAGEDPHPVVRRTARRALSLSR